MPARFRYGFIGSSDNHKARAGTGYKEFGRKAMADGWGFRDDVLQFAESESEGGAEPVDFESVPIATLLAPERGASFYYTGGLVAVHAEGRTREEIWHSLEQREVYGTSGDRILLWFDLIDGAAVGSPTDPAGCRIEFEDPDFLTQGRERVYYVRAIQEPSLAVGGDPLRCERDAAGRCIKTRPCYASGPQFDPSDECLAPIEERAWSSPIFLQPS